MSEPILALVRSLSTPQQPRSRLDTAMETAMLRAALIPIKRLMRLGVIQEEMEHLPGEKRARRTVSKTFEASWPIIDPAKTKRVVYCVVLEPDTVDAQGDVMSADEIENTAQDFVRQGRVIGSMHRQRIGAVCVESYVAPQDLHFPTGMYGPQTVKQGSWVIGIEILDDAEWQKIVDGTYTGVSVGGFGLREPLD